jgi:thiamine transporter ThiT
MKNWKPIFIENSRVPVLLSYLAPINIGAITLFFLVFSRGEMSDTTKRHETIHFQQMLETFVIGFLILYLWDYLKGYIKYGNGKSAYLGIRAEQEAYQEEGSKPYLNERIRWRWIFNYKV